MLRHVFLHASLEGRYADRGGEVRGDLQEAGFDRSLVEANVTGMSALVSRLHARGGASEWKDYRSTCTYDDRDAVAKDDFVRRVVGSGKRGLVWDLGCNDGRFSRIAAESADFVVAVDSDRHVIETLFTQLRAGAERNDPAPGRRPHESVSGHWVGERRAGDSPSAWQTCAGALPRSRSSPLHLRERPSS